MGKSELYYIDINQQLQITNESSSKILYVDQIIIDFKYDTSIVDHANISIQNVEINHLKPYLIAVCTSSGLYLINVNKYTRLKNILFNWTFTTNLAIQQAKNIIVSG